METPETPYIAPDILDSIRNYLQNEWSNATMESTPCLCGRQKDAMYRKAFCWGFKGGKHAYVRISEHDDNYIQEQLQIPYSDSAPIRHILFDMILEIVKDELNVRSVGVKAPGLCACANVPPRIINNPDPYIF